MKKRLMLKLRGAKEADQTEKVIKIVAQKSTFVMFSSKGFHSDVDISLTLQQEGNLKKKKKREKQEGKKLKVTV